MKSLVKTIKKVFNSSSVKTNEPIKEVRRIKCFLNGDDLAHLDFFGKLFFDNIKAMEESYSNANYDAKTDITILRNSDFSVSCGIDKFHKTLDAFEKANMKDRFTSAYLGEKFLTTEIGIYDDVDFCYGDLDLRVQHFEKNYEKNPDDILFCLYAGIPTRSWYFDKDKIDDIHCGVYKHLPAIFIDTKNIEHFRYRDSNGQMQTMGDPFGGGGFYYDSRMPLRTLCLGFENASKMAKVKNNSSKESLENETLSEI